MYLPLILLASAALSYAQTAAQNASLAALEAGIPTCVLPCTTLAFADIGCSNSDAACHCAHMAALEEVVQPCLYQNATCNGTELVAYKNITTQICTIVNSTTSGNTTTSASLGLATGTGISPSVVNSTLISTATASGAGGGGASTFTSTATSEASRALTSGGGSATAVPTGPSTTSGAPTTASSSAAGRLVSVGNELFVAFGALGAIGMVL